MKTKNISFKEIIKIINERLTYVIKHEFLKSVLSYEIENECSRKDMYFTIYNDGWTFGIDPLFESVDQVGKYIETGRL